LRRLLVIDIDGGAGNFFTLECLDQGARVDERQRVRY
jgi:hypothetical protein